MRSLLPLLITAATLVLSVAGAQPPPGESNPFAPPRATVQQAGARLRLAARRRRTPGRLPSAGRSAARLPTRCRPGGDGLETVSLHCGSNLKVEAVRNRGPEVGVQAGRRHAAHYGPSAAAARPAGGSDSPLSAGNGSRNGFMDPVAGTGSRRRPTRRASDSGPRGRPTATTTGCRRGTTRTTSRPPRRRPRCPRTGR